MNNWLGERIQKLTATVEVTAGKHVFTAEFEKTGDEEATMSAVGTLSLYIDDDAVGSLQITTQPGWLSLTGDGLCVGRDGNSPASSDYKAPYELTGGTIDRRWSTSRATTTSTTRRKCSPTWRATNDGAVAAYEEGSSSSAQELMQ